MEGIIGKRLIDAFFWIEPLRPDVNSPFQTTKVLWHFPEDVSAISKQFRDIPQFCFPDLNGIKLEKAGDVTSDQYIFTLTDKEGSRFYGICYRHFFRGISRRFDISRRNKHCLCIITKYPYFAFFKNLLKDIFSVGLLEHSRGVCKVFVYQMLERMIAEVNQGQALVKVPQLLPFPLEHITSLSYLPEFHYHIPKSSKFYLKDITMLPLFQILGVDRFFKLLSAILCEQRILFISNDVSLLTSTIFSALVMIYPFHWHHVFITLLPAKLVNYLAAPVPYIIGVKKSVLSEVSRDLAQGVLVVDLDQGDIFPNGKVVLLDLVGDSGTALRQASEGLDRVRQGVASMFLGKSATDNETATQRDLMAMLIADLKSALSAKPSSNAIAGLLRGLPGSSKTFEEARAQWGLETEKTIRENLTCFFVFLFADLDEFWIGDLTGRGSTSASTSSGGGSSSGRGSSDLVFHPRDFRAKFDLKAFMYRKLQNGLSKLLQEFLMEFLHSQMFEKYCEEKYLQRTQDSTSAAAARGNRSTSTSSTTSTGSQEVTQQEVEDLFDAACGELRYRQLPVNPVNAKQAVSARSTLHLGDSSSSSSGSGSGGGGGYGSTGKINLAGFHTWTLQYTAPIDLEAIGSVEVFDPYFGSSGKKSTLQATQSSIFERILQDCYHSDLIRKIFHTITFRLEALRAGGLRGASAVAGIKTLQLLHLLLVQGPSLTLPLALELIPLLRDLLRLNRHLARTTKTTTSIAFDFIVGGSYVSPLSAVLVVFGLLCDHRRLLVQRSVWLLEAQQTPPQSTSNKPGSLARTASTTTTVGSKSSQQPPRKELLVNATTHGKIFPGFKQLHMKLNETNQSSIREGLLRVSVPEKASLVERDEEDNNIRDRTETTSTSLLEFEDDPPTPPAVTTARSVSPNPPLGNLPSKASTASSSTASMPRTTSPKGNQDPFQRTDPFATPATTAATTIRGNTSPQRAPPSSAAANSNNPQTRSNKTPVKTNQPPRGNHHSNNVDLLQLEEEDLESTPYRLKNLDTVTATTTSTGMSKTGSSLPAPALPPPLRPPRTTNATTTSSKTSSSTATSSTDPFASNIDVFGNTTASATATAVKVSDPFSTTSFSSDWATPSTAPTTASSNKSATGTSASSGFDPTWSSTDPFGAPSFDFATTTASSASSSNKTAAAVVKSISDPFATSDPFASFGAAPAGAKPADPFASSNPFPATSSFDFPPATTGFGSNPLPPPRPPAFVPILTNPPPGYQYQGYKQTAAPKDPFADLLNLEKKK